jgi:hypothetical protein
VRGVWVASLPEVLEAHQGASAALGDAPLVGGKGNINCRGLWAVWRLRYVKQTPQI